MQKDPSFTKEKADFIFNKINNYYNQHAYKQALSEMEIHKELIASSLNIGSQLKLNKIYTHCITNIMLDAFEVDGDTGLFSDLMTKNHTNLELHSNRDIFQLFSEYNSQRERHPNFKSQSQRRNVDVEPDQTPFHSASSSPKETTRTSPLETEVGRDFLDSIERPSFHFAPLGEDEEGGTKVIKSDVDIKAIHEDFFDSIASPGNAYGTKPAPSGHKEISSDPEPLKRSQKNSKQGAEKSPVAGPENKDASDKFKQQNPFAGESKKRKDKASEKASEDLSSSNQPIRESPEGAYQNINIKEKIETIENGNKVTRITHKSGGKVTEYTLGDEIEKPAPMKIATKASARAQAQSSEKAQKSENEKLQPKKPSNGTKKSSSEPKKSKTLPHAKNPEITKPKESGLAKREKAVRIQNPEPESPVKAPANSSLPAAQNKKPINKSFLYLLLALMVAALSYGGFRLLNQPKAPESADVPGLTDEQTPGDSETPTGPEEPAIDEVIDPSSPADEPPAPESPAPNTYILPSSEREITEADFEGLAKSEVRLAINEMFARHGWNFGGGGDLYEYFSQQDWYEPDMTYTSTSQAEQKFTPLERQNLQTILAKFRSM